MILWRPSDGHDYSKRDPVARDPRSLWPDEFIAAELAKIPYEDRLYYKAAAEAAAQQTGERLRRNAQIARDRRRDEDNHTCQCSHCTDPF